MSEEGFKNNFKRLSTDRKSRVMLITVVVIIVAGLAYAFSSSGEKIQSANLRGPTSLGNNPPGGVEPSPKYIEVIKNDDINRAAQNPNSLPTPIYGGSGDRKIPSLSPDREELGRGDSSANNQIPSLTLPVAEPLKIPDATTPVVAPVVIASASPIDRDLIGAMQAQMRTILTRSLKPSETTYFFNTSQDGTASKNPNTSSTPSMTSTFSSNQNPTNNLNYGNNSQSNQSNQSPVAQNTSNVQRPSRFSAPAPGTILYSRLIGKVNSDVPGPVIAEISQGALRGARLLGSFQFTEQGVIMQFSSMTIPFSDDEMERTEVVPIKAVAVDPENLGTAMATDIDRRIFERVAFGFASSFIQGLGQAVSQAGSMTTVLPSGGVTYGLKSLNATQQLITAGGAAAGTTGKILDQTYGNRRTTITVDSDTPFGLLFLGNNNAQ